jgi:hypothetical protein
MDTSIFDDLDALRIDPSELARKSTKSVRKWRRHYVRVPWTWVERLQAAKRVSSWQLAVLLVYEAWRTGNSTIVLSNVFSGSEGLSRRSKWNALTELERLGLLQVERHRRRSPRVTILHLDREPSRARSCPLV